MADIRFKDLDLDFSRHPLTNDVSFKINSEAVKRSLRNLILLRRNEVFLKPDVFSGVSDLLFEPANFMTASEIKKRIETMIINYEPRVKEVSVKVGYNQDNNEFQISITFSIKNSVSTSESLNVNIERLR